MQHVRRPQTSRHRRRGMATSQLVMALGALFAFSAAMHQLAVEACRNLYHVIATLVGGPL